MGQDSLVYHIFKAKYFPNCDFVEASLGANPSYVRRSLIAAQKLAQDGLRWQIGNGSRCRCGMINGCQVLQPIKLFLQG